ncbi:glycosyltransferase family 2 protein [Pinibacter soli]|uniref:Glycosyltransferase family 2 protein n=1 Tax=Pinibacter soli TaxID=3044211 RepID=A0ABT6R990_9BACT|nr:glycosyltransferase family 2 protein [Pinibacter soli]MDI3318464.1 glycosyltransferase family 2 protein [Pinibacter soli]
MKPQNEILISGFTMVRNATKLYYPIKASIESILPIVDEFVVALGNCDAEDHTLEEIQKINSDKIRIVNTVWDLEGYPNGGEYAHQTDIAKSECKGKWLFYLQSDEVVHEKYLPAIRKKCEELENNNEIEGLLFDYKHFWGDYSHHIVSHAWYAEEIRIIRNNPDIHSWRDAQSFRRIPNFDGRSYFQKEDTFKLKVVKVDACIYHYGWVRPPQLMQKKKISFETDVNGKEKVAEMFKDASNEFDYGDLSKLEVFKETHPAAMNEFIARFNWQDQLYPNRSFYQKHKHDKTKYRVLSFIEQNILGGKQIASFKNYIKVKPSR